MEPFELQPHRARANIECRRAYSHGAKFAEFTPRTQRLAQYARFAPNNDARKIASRFTFELARDGSAQFTFEFGGAFECCKIFFDQAQEALSESIVVGVE